MGHNITLEMMLKLFYWNNGNMHIFSRTKFIAIVTFIVCFIESISSPPLIFGFIFSLIVSIVVFIVGFFIHKLMKIDSSFYKGNLSEDIKHFLFYWYERTNKFRLSKTKSISFIMILVGILCGFSSSFAGNEMGYALAYNIFFLIFAIPIFLIGFFIHKYRSKKDDYLVSNNNYGNYNEQKVDNDYETKLQINKSNIPSKFNSYVLKVEELKKEFDEKELKVKELISTNFTPPQITYDNFMSVVDNCCEIFNQHYIAVFNIVKYGDEDSSVTYNEITSKINILQSFIDKLDDLLNELVINMSKSNMDDVDNVLKDMEDLISSINNYKY